MFDTEMAFYFRKFNILYSHILASKSRMSAKIKYIYKKKTIQCIQYTYNIILAYEISAYIYGNKVKDMIIIN